MRIRKNRDHQKVLLMQGYLSEVNLNYFLFSYNFCDAVIQNHVMLQF